MKYIVSFLVGFAASKLLYAPMHSDGFPEIGRYACGVILLAFCAEMFGVPAEKVLVPGIFVGSGVAVARLVQ